MLKFISTSGYNGADRALLILKLVVYTFFLQNLGHPDKIYAACNRQNEKR